MEVQKSIFQSAFTEIYNNSEFNETIIDRYFSDDYLHFADGRVKNLNQLKQHLRHQMDRFESMEFKILDLAAEKNKVFGIYKLTVTPKTGHKTFWLGEGLFYMNQETITRCFELTHQIENPDQDELLKFFSPST